MKLEELHSCLSKIPISRHYKVSCIPSNSVLRTHYSRDTVYIYVKCLPEITLSLLSFIFWKVVVWIIHLVQRLFWSLSQCKCCAASLLRRDSGPVDCIVEPQLWWWQDQQFPSHHIPPHTQAYSGEAPANNFLINKSYNISSYYW